MKSGRTNGYLPEDFKPDRNTQNEQLKRIINDYGKHNPSFDVDAALDTLAGDDPDEDAKRGDMFIVLAAGLGIDYDPDDPFDVADELADRGILRGHDKDGDGVANPYTRPDADADSKMTNEMLAAFLSRIPKSDDSGPTVRPPPPDTRPPPTNPPPTNPPPTNPPPTDPPRGGGDPDDDMCTTSLALAGGDRDRLLAQVQWTTLVGIEAQGEPGKPWPPHPGLPGGSEYLVVAESPVWPVADQGGVWYIVSDDGCLWEVVGLRARLTEMKPWRPGDRAAIERAGTARPAVGFGTYLSRWDNLSTAEQAQIQRHHTDRDVSVRCDLETAMVSVDSYDRCRWQLPAPGLWAWQVRACFRGATEDATYHQCAILDDGIEWFRQIIDYTAGISLRHDAGTASDTESRRPATSA